MRDQYVRAGRGLVLAATAFMALAGCGGGGGESSGDAMKVAVLLTGPISDDGWNASAWEGVEAIGQELGATTARVESLDKSRFEENLRQFAAEGYDLVFGHAYEFQDATLRVAQDYPQTTFVVVAGNRSAANVGAVHFRLEEASYVLGALAAELSDAPVIGLVGGEEIPSLKPGFDGFANGAKSIRPDIQVVTKYVGNWHDVALGREHAEALIAQGADFIFQNADKAGLGVFQAAGEHEGVFAFGSNKDQNDVAPEAILASAVLDVPAAYLQIAREVQAGTYEPAARAMGVAESVVSVVINPQHATRLGPDAAELVGALEVRIADGSLDVLAAR